MIILYDKTVMLHACTSNALKPTGLLSLQVVHHVAVSSSDLTVSYVPQQIAADGALKYTRGLMPRHNADQPSSATMRRMVGNCRCNMSIKCDTISK
jgi:hypothetical protein